MNKIKNAFYGATATVIALAPAIASAQWMPSTAGTGTNLGSQSISAVLTTLMKGLLGLVGFLGIIGFVVSGILYLTAAGDEDQVDKAKKAMLYSIIGVIVALLGWIVITALSTWLASNKTTF